MLDPVTNISKDLAENPTVSSGAECIGCRRILPWGFFKKDSSQRTGHVSLCDICSSVPRLNTAEHTARLRERNLNSEDLERQRQPFQEELRAGGRVGRAIPASDFVSILKKIIPNLYVMDGNIKGDLSLFRTYGSPQPDLEGRTFKYIGYIEGTGILPEFSIWEFDEIRNIAIREKQRGWRSCLLMLIRAGVLTEDVCNKVFGIPTGVASTRWHRTLHAWRNS